MSSGETAPLHHPDPSHEERAELERSETGTEGARGGGGGVNVSNRTWTVAVFSLIASVGSLVVGMSMGYRAEIYSLHPEGIFMQAGESEAWTTHWFGVSYPPSPVSSSLVPRPFNMYIGMCVRRDGSTCSYIWRPDYA